jgi:hypothetical protein
MAECDAITYEDQDESQMIEMVLHKYKRTFKLGALYT